MEQMNESRRLGEEKISKLLLKFSIPCITGLLISAFYNIVDQIFIGNSELGFLGNAATGVSFPVICIANAFAWCIGDGAASFLSICAGRKDTQSAHKCVGTGITVSMAISIVLAAICVIFAEPIMMLFGASEQTLEMAVEYFVIVSAAFPFYLVLGAINSMIRADGSPTFAMIGTLVGAVINIILDPVFIFIFKWGIAGAAWATVIGQIVSFTVCMLYFLKPKTFKLCWKSFIPDWQIFRSTVSLGASTFVTQLSIVVISLVCNITLAEYGALSIYGPDIPISVFSIQTKVYTIVCSIVTGIVLGAQPIFGYNYGAKRMDRVKETYNVVLKSSLVVGIAATLVFELCPQVIINIFGSGNELYYDFAVKTFRIYLSLMTFTCLTKMTSVFFQAIGKPVKAVAASLVRDILCFTPIAIILPAILERREAGTGIYGILFAAPVADLIALIVIICITVPFIRSLKNTEQEETVEVTTAIKPSRPGVIITIAREHGSGGKEIGRLIAEKMNIPFYYKEMTAIAAQESGLDKQFMSEINSDSPNLLRELYMSTNVVQQAVVAQEEIIRRIAENGSCVIVGRAADYVLRDYDNVVSVFVHAPKDFRAKRIMEVYGDGEEEAMANIKRSDASRSAYYRTISSQSWGDPHHFDICIDSSVGLEKCVDIISAYAES
ncbi:MAG: MATE family efflux transporter [Oscillospiraceae bacterium]|nr:MATE family efflux transporter [Oscillospiraceae bacterium]